LSYFLALEHAIWPSCGRPNSGTPGFPLWFLFMEFSLRNYIALYLQRFVRSAIGTLTWAGLVQKRAWKSKCSSLLSNCAATIFRMASRSRRSFDGGSKDVQICDVSTRLKKYIVFSVLVEVGVV